ncbi:MAG: hypothetical protein GF383_14650, partial [Candidatus Lokiarchaeota archaeon]|nr:hypothetical protein [Candidatus Lokiarchaeota archaeon]
FMGTGTTAKVCRLLGRSVIGIELNLKFCKLIEKRTRQKGIIDYFDKKKTTKNIINGDARDVLEIWEKHNFPQVDYCITSPPYWNALRKSRGGIESQHKKREKKGLDLYYSDDPNDLGNIKNYGMFLNAVAKIFMDIYEILKDGSHLTVVVQNIFENEKMIPFAWDLGIMLMRKFDLIQDKLWLQDDKMLGIWGYPTSYVPNTAHHYCLNFKKRGNKTTR